jgi:hypothetical protein
MITWVDWGIWLVYFTVIYTVLWFYRQTKTDDDTYKWFLKGFLIKVIGSIAFALIFVYYYKFGDSFEYYKGATMLSNTLLDSPSDYFELLFHESSTNFPGHLRQYTDPLAYSDTPEEWFMVKLISPISLITFNSYLTINLLMGIISFWGGWKLFKVFSSILPNKINWAFYAAFLIPSMVFWGSGLMKDTITLAGINYLIYVFYFSLIKKQKKILFTFGTIIWGYIVFTLKSYILLSFLPSVFLLFYFHYKSYIKSPIIRFISTPLILSTFLVIGFFSLKTLSESSQKYSAQQLEWKVKGFHSWHTTLGGSAYNLGEVEYTTAGVISKIPAGLNVTFFRPYLWEARNPVVLLSAIESLILFVLFVFTLYKTKLKPFKYLKKTILLKSLVAFILIFGFAVGFTSYNFGALSRYKMPIMSLFTFILLYINYKQSKPTT